MTVYLVISLPRIPYIHRIDMVLANPNNNAASAVMAVLIRFQFNAMVQFNTIMQIRITQFVCYEQGFDKVCESPRTLEMLEQFDVQFREWRILMVSVVILVLNMLLLS